MTTILENFIVFESCDGAGTTTQINLLKQSKLKNVIYTAEPTEGPVGKLVRSVLQKEVSVEPETLASLFAADRREHIKNIKELISQGNKVVCDRYVVSSFVYQGITCGASFVNLQNKDFPLPEKIFFFDIDPEVSMKRIESRGEKKELFEKLDFQKRVYNKYRKYLDVVSKKGVEIHIINAETDMKSIHEFILKNI
jgi:dTMP kinase